MLVATFAAMSGSTPLRFTTFLRNGTELAHALPVTSHEAIATLRQRVISSRSQARMRKESFTWSNFSRNLKATSTRAVAELRKVFNNFIVASKDVVAESSEVEGMTAAVAELIYSSVVDGHASGGDDADLRRNMLQDLGTVNEAALASALPLAEQLFTLSGAAADALASPGGLLSPSTMGPAAREYGRDLVIDPVFGPTSQVEEAIAEVALLEQCQRQRMVFLDSQRKSSYGSFNVGVGTRGVGSASTATTTSSSSAAGASSATGETPSSSDGGDLPVNASWLLRKCEQHLVVAPHALFDAGQLAQELLAAVKHAKSDAAQLQAALFDLLGADGFDFIVEVVQNSSALQRIKKTTLMAMAAGAGLAAGSLDAGINGAPRYNPNSQKGRAMARRHERELEAANRRMLQEIEDMQSGNSGAGGGGGNSGGNNSGGAKKERSAREIFGLGSTQGATFGRTQLPDGAVRKDMEGVSEVTIPAKPRPKLDKSKLVKISEFDEFAQTAFQGISHLNRLQSDLFQVAYVCWLGGAACACKVVSLIVHRRFARRNNSLDFIHCIIWLRCVAGIVATEIC